MTVSSPSTETKSDKQPPKEPPYIATAAEHENDDLGNIIANLDAEDAKLLAGVLAKTIAQNK